MQRLFEKTAYTDLHRELEKRILSRIARARLVRERIRVGLFGGMAFASALAFIPAIGFAWQEVLHSAFYTYASLVFTDGGALASSWREFGLVLVESAPVWGAIMTLAVTFVFLASLRAVARHAGNIFSSRESFAS